MDCLLCKFYSGMDFCKTRNGVLAVGLDVRFWIKTEPTSPSNYIP